MAAKILFVILALAVLTTFVMAENEDMDGFGEDALLEMVKRGKKGKAAFYSKYSLTSRYAVNLTYRSKIIEPYFI